MAHSSSDNRDPTVQSLPVLDIVFTCFQFSAYIKQKIKYQRLYFAWSFLFCILFSSYLIPCLVLHLFLYLHCSLSCPSPCHVLALVLSCSCLNFVSPIRNEKDTAVYYTSVLYLFAWRVATFAMWITVSQIQPVHKSHSLYPALAKLPTQPRRCSSFLHPC